MSKPTRWHKNLIPEKPPANYVEPSQLGGDAWHMMLKAVEKSNELNPAEDGFKRFVYDLEVRIRDFKTGETVDKKIYENIDLNP